MINIEFNTEIADRAHRAAGLCRHNVEPEFKGIEAGDELGKLLWITGALPCPQQFGFP
jgi:hypothetical protein